MSEVAQLVLVFLLVVNLHGEKIRREGDFLSSDFPKSASYCLVLRFMDGEKQVAFNSSDPLAETSWVPEEPELGGQEVHPKNYTRYVVHNLTQSHTGEYQEQCWSQKELILNRTFSLVVCDAVGEGRSFETEAGKTVRLRCDGAGDGLTTQWFRSEPGSHEEPWRERRFLPIDLRGRFGLERNTSDLVLSNVLLADSTMFFCLVRRAGRCVGGHPVNIDVESRFVLALVGDVVEMTCAGSDEFDDRPPVWTSDFHVLSWIPHVLKGNKSFVIPSAAFNHSGTYSCAVGGLLSNSYLLMVCPKAEETVFFSEGEKVSFLCDEWTMSSLPFWIMESMRTNGTAMSVHRFKGGNIEVLRHGPLVISNISQADAGIYSCAHLNFHDGFSCVQTFRLLPKNGDEVTLQVYEFRYVLLSACLVALCVLVAVVTRRAEGGRRREGRRLA